MASPHISTKPNRCLWQQISTALGTVSLNRDRSVTYKLQMWEWLRVGQGAPGRAWSESPFPNYGGVCVLGPLCSGEQG